MENLTTEQYAESFTNGQCSQAVAQFRQALADRVHPLALLIGVHALLKNSDRAFWLAAQIINGGDNA